MPKADNLVGNKYGQLVVIEKAGKNKRNRTIWRCKCDCGREKISQGYMLKRGIVSSCGICCKVNRTRKMRYKPTQFERERMVKLIMLYSKISKHTRVDGQKFKEICKYVDQVNLWVIQR